MSDVLDLLNEQGRQRYLDRACKDGYAILPDLNAVKNRIRAKQNESNADVDESAADGEASDTGNGAVLAGSAGADAAGSPDCDDRTKLLDDESEHSGSGSDEDENGDETEEEDDDGEGSMVASVQNKRKMADGDSRPMSKRMRIAYWSCFTLVFSAGAACIVLLVLASPTCDSTPPSDGGELAWWQRTVIYQVYPRSLQDSDGDGVGDLAGITSRLDYIHGLGVRTVWLSPMFESPMADFGYDISNYTAVAPVFGTLDDFDRLLSAAHALGMQLLLDFVPNHTSDQHAWFVESRSSRTNAKRDWYVWHDGASGGGPPNNWQSVFGGSAWQYDGTTGQYYLHQFATAQPDLNVRNPQVLAALEDVLRFWLRRGVDGFRVDAVAFLLEDPELRDETCAVNGSESSTTCAEWGAMNHTRTFAQPGFRAVLRSFREVLDAPEFFNATHPRLMVGEMYAPSLADVVALYGNASSPVCHFPFNFLLLGLTAAEWTGTRVGETVATWLGATTVPAQWPNWVLGNHDNARVASRLGAPLARAANFLLLTLPGTPTTYYGEEIGMTDGNVTWNRTVDPQAINTGDLRLSRDPERTPMQWNGSLNAGFASPGVETWLPVGDAYAEVNVALQEARPRSMLQLYKRLVAVRTAEPALQHAGYRLVLATPAILAYAREYDATPAVNQYLVVLNFGLTAVSNVNLTGDALAAYRPLGRVELSSSLSTNANATLDLASIAMAPGEAFLVRLAPL